MKNKKYIMENDKVIKCTYNIANMNPFEYCYYDIFYWNFYQCIRI